MEKDKALPVLIVDDHVFVREGIRSILEGYADLHVVGEAGDGLEAISCVDSLRPSVVVMDINMPKMNGIEATARIRRRHPDTIVIGLSVNTGTANQEAMTRAGAVRLIPKETVTDELYEVIQDAVKARRTSEMEEDG
jgi:DNA-binding NarL/FixJ family response regulator